ncbi:MAG: hypothetical protein QOH37_3240 [Nocardioidaceae bacterium]|jgi:hypothetical protein|nr:hypothetical protein [Nocardioidaceae bacterium]
MADGPLASEFGVTVSAGTLRAEAPGWTIPHPWTDAGVAVQGGGNGATMLHAAIALCVLNDTFREAGALGVEVRGVRVHADGGFDTEVWVSGGITYRVEVDSPASSAELVALHARVDDVAEIPRVLRAGASVDRVPEAAR